MASRHYAKRQFTWFRKEPLFKWLNVEVHDFEIAADMILQEYQSLI
jgi:tRNA dimethylallyltransferase